MFKSLILSGFLLASIIHALPEERLRLIHADVLENITDADGKSVQYLSGNVKFQKGDAIITSNRSIYHNRDQIGWFVDSVKLDNNEQVLTTDSLIFDSKNNKMTGIGQIHFTDGEYELISDTLHYLMEADSGIASGNVYFTQKRQTITANHLSYRKKRRGRCSQLYSHWRSKNRGRKS